MKTILVDAVYCFVIPQDDKFVIFQEMYDLLETFPTTKILLTGANNEQMKKYGLDNVPYDVFTWRNDPPKADPRYYTLMLEHFTLEPADVVYFEHDPKAVKSAQSVGILTYHYDQQQKDLGALKQFLTENLKVS